MYKQTLLFLLSLVVTTSTFSQGKLKSLGGNLSRSNNSRSPSDSLSNNKETRVELSGKTTYTDYKIISFKKDTTLIDTTLTLKKEYAFNFLRKDNFELLPFHNQGQTFNNLAYDFSNLSVFPEFGFRAKHFNFYELEDVDYYQLPTPTTEILYRTGLQQGQLLDALFTLNFSERFNIGIAYKGIRSLGHYRRTLASHGNFRSSFHYQTPKNQYTIKGQVVFQDLTNQENGGLTEASLNAFVTDDPNSANDRDRLDVNLNDTENLLDNKRYYFEQTYRLFSTETKEEVVVKKQINKTDTIAKVLNRKNTGISKTKIAENLPTNKTDKNFTNLKLGHLFLLDNKFYTLTQDTQNNDLFGEAITSGRIENKVEYQLIKNEVFLDFNSKYILGNFRGRLAHTTYEYGYRTFLNNNAFPDITLNKLGGEAISFGGDWNAKIKNFKLNASATITPGNGRLAGSDFKGEAIYKKDSLFLIKGRLNINSRLPNFNMLFHQSTYNNYNWQNNFTPVNSRIIGGIIESKWGNASLDFTNISNYVYFDENSLPNQASENVTYIKLKINKEFKLGKFGLDNTIMYQNVSSGDSFFRVPELVTRNTFYYADEWFKGKPLLVNMGVTFKYFTKYKANAYDPLLSEFRIQNDTEIGFPTFDVFFNARVRRTRIYFKLDNVTSSFTSKNYFSAPNYPYRDLSIRFGVVWNWFI